MTFSTSLHSAFVGTSVALATYLTPQAPAIANETHLTLQAPATANETQTPKPQQKDKATITSDIPYIVGSLILAAGGLGAIAFGLNDLQNKAKNVLEECERYQNRNNNKII